MIQPWAWTASQTGYLQSPLKMLSPAHLIRVCLLYSHNSEFSLGKGCSSQGKLKH